MVTKTFETTVPFQHFQTQSGEYWLPIVQVTFVDVNIDVPMVFDTGASSTALRHDLFALVGATAWDQGVKGDAATAGDDKPADTYRYDDVQLEVFGKRIKAPVLLVELPPHPAYLGLLGREAIFDEFGFGFWESAHEIYVTENTT